MEKFYVYFCSKTNFSEILVEHQLKSNEQWGNGNKQQEKINEQWAESNEQ